MPPQPLRVSEVEIVPIKPKEGLVAFTSFVIDDRFYVGDVAIYTRPSGGYRLVYPRKTLPNGRCINVLHPINRMTGEVLEQAVISRFEELTEQVMRMNKGDVHESTSTQ